MPQVTLSAKNQIVIPREARKALRVKAGDKLLVVVRGDKVIVLEKPKAHHAATGPEGWRIPSRLPSKGTQELGLTRLRVFLSQHRHIALDTCVFIYQLEANAQYAGLTDCIFRWLEQEAIEL